MGSLIRNILTASSRKKTLIVHPKSTSLKRCLSLFDLTCLCVGSIIGAGIFVFAGSSIRDLAGPGIIFSFVMAAIPAIISAFCYAEFSARVPTAGGTYTFVYVTLGEFWASLVGWLMISAPVFVGAMASRTWATYFDTMIGGWIANRTMETVGAFDSPYLSPYPDFFAASLIIFFCVVVSTGAKGSILFNNIFSIMKLLAIGFIICYGFSFADIKNWTNTENGGFLPMGFSGIMNAAPTAFFAYFGFEAACSAAEEAKNPRRDLILATLMSFTISAIVYILMCAVLTLMIPYNEVAPVSSFASAFTQRGVEWATYVVTIGALSALTNVLFGTIFAVPRTIYAVSSDGLIFQWLAVVNPCTKIPLRAICIYAILTIGVMLVLNLQTLVETLSVAGIFCSLLVASSVVILRYRPRSDPQSPNRAGYLKEKYAKSKLLDSILGQLQPGNVVLIMIAAEVFVMSGLSCAITYAPWKETTSVMFIISMVIMLLLATVLIAQQIIIMLFTQNEDEHLWFKVPLVPILPSIGMFVNILMMFRLSPFALLKFGGYISIGAIIYLVYGMHNSVLRHIDEKEMQKMIIIQENQQEKHKEIEC